MFSGRRLSQDSVLRERIFELCKDSTLRMNNYSAKQFENAAGIAVSEDFLNLAAPDDFCFIENAEIPIEKADVVYLFNWNRDYPADVFFDVSQLSPDFKRSSREFFSGTSHKKITLEVYKRKNLEG